MKSDEGSKTKPKSISPDFAKFPKIWLGYILAALFLILEIGEAILHPEASQQQVSLWPILISLTGLVYWCICVYKIHKILLHVTDNHYPVSPARAVGFGFLPIYNIYWMFKWPSEIIHFVNSRDISKKSIVWLPGLVLLASTFAGRIDGTLGILFSFGVLSHLTNSIKKSLDNRPEILPYKDRSTRLSAGVVVAIVFLCTLPILGILAAIAIPSFIRAKQTAIISSRRVVLKQIDTAKEIWFLETGASGDAIPTWNDLVPDYIESKPTDSQGGRYKIGSVDSPSQYLTEDNKLWVDTEKYDTAY